MNDQPKPETAKAPQPASKTTPKSVKGRRWALAAAGAVAFLLIAGAAALLGYRWAIEAYEGPGPHSEEVVIQIERGLGLSAIAARLERAGVVRDARLAEAAARIEGVGAALKAGEYAFPPRESLKDVLARMVEGRTVVHRLTVPEGLTSVEVLRLVAAHPALAGDPPALPPEGSLLPETYVFERGLERAALISMMADAQDAVLDALWAERQPDLPLKDRQEAVILASIVEKETGLDQERGRVAAVFINRLNLGMRLQSDPTIIYGITGGDGPLGRPILRSEIDAVTDYNTYQIDGLPPTPIANPGRDAIEAVLDPPETDELYFVADGSGGHVFAKTIGEHRKNVAAWRKIERERRQSLQ